MKSTRFSVSSRLVGDIAVIYPSGYLNNLAGKSLIEECGLHTANGIKKLVLNLRDTGFINSIGISMLLNIIEDLKKVDGRLCFTEMSRTHTDTFDMLGLTPHIVVFTTEDEALQFLKETPGPEPKDRDEN